MERRSFLKTATIGAAAAAFGRGLAFAQEHFPVQVDESLWKGINKVKDAQNETGLEKKHVPVINAPEKVKAGEVFEVDVTIGKVLHPMGPNHWIEYVQLDIGNEPAGMTTFRSRGWLKPKTTFAVVLDEKLKGKKISLVATEKCNLHGLWQHHVNIQVV